MTGADSTNDQNTMRLRLHLQINDQNTYQKKNLKLTYFHFYDRKIR